jgi:hypothetical protein
MQQKFVKMQQHSSREICRDILPLHARLRTHASLWGFWRLLRLFVSMTYRQHARSCVCSDVEDVVVNTALLLAAEAGGNVDVLADALTRQLLQRRGCGSVNAAAGPVCDAAGAVKLQRHSSRKNMQRHPTPACKAEHACKSVGLLETAAVVCQCLSVCLSVSSTYCQHARSCSFGDVGCGGGYVFVLVAEAEGDVGDLPDALALQLLQQISCFFVSYQARVGLVKQHRMV